MKRPKLNIWLHLPVALGFAWFAYEGGNSFFGGMMATLSLFILCDMYECIRKYVKEQK